MFFLLTFICCQESTNEENIDESESNEEFQSDIKIDSFDIHGFVPIFNLNYNQGEFVLYKKDSLFNMSRSFISEIHVQSELFFQKLATLNGKLVKYRCYFNEKSNDYRNVIYLFNSNLIITDSIEFKRKSPSSSAQCNDFNFECFYQIGNNLFLRNEFNQEYPMFIRFEFEEQDKIYYESKLSTESEIDLINLKIVNPEDLEPCLMKKINKDYLNLGNYFIVKSHNEVNVYKIRENYLELLTNVKTPIEFCYPTKNGFYFVSSNVLIRYTW